MPPLPIGNAERRFKLFLQGKGLRVTEERLAILRAVNKLSGHINADELSYQLRQNGVDVSRATVYRTLSHLVEAGLARKVDFGSGHANYERSDLADGHHDHIICTKCGKIIEFYNSELEDLQGKIAEQHGFHIVAHQFQIVGICPDCRTKP
ncbi:MAG: transcriptional repressor [bacterium]|nr:transcriptional repressor [bacterium]